MTEITTGNRGEWAEIYVFLKILNEGKLYAADSGMQLNKAVYLNILKILREEIPNRLIEYEPSHNNEDKKTRNITYTVWDKTENEKLDIGFVSSEDVQKCAKKVWDLIKNAKPKEGIEDRNVSKFLAIKLKVTKLKAPAQQGTKSFFGGTPDINFLASDYRTGVESLLAYSIKTSFPTGKATLFNASADNTNFQYEVIGCNEQIMEAFNCLWDTDSSGKKSTSFSKRMNLLKESNCDLRFEKTCGEFTALNLITSGGKELPGITAALLKYYYFNSSAKKEHSSVKEACEYVSEHDAENADYGISNCLYIYEKKISNLLFDMFTGMRMSKPWNGKVSVNGGYVVVKDDGEIVAVHSCMTEEFKQYLYENLCFESPSAKRHKFMTIYCENNKFYLNLNLQIRFK